MTIQEYIEALWAPDRYRARDYADMSLEEVRDLVKSRREGRRGRPQYSLEDVSEHIWTESVAPSPSLDQDKDEEPVSHVRTLMGSYSKEKLLDLCKILEDGSPVEETCFTDEDFQELRRAIRADNYESYKQRRDGSRADYSRGKSKGRRWQDHKRH